MNIQLIGFNIHQTNHVIKLFFNKNGNLHTLTVGIEYYALSLINGLTAMTPEEALAKINLQTKINNLVTQQIPANETLL